MKTHVNEWLVTNANYIEEIVDNLGVARCSSINLTCPSADDGPPTTKDIARIMKPPAPPVGAVLAGYNPILDKPRPTKIQDYLR